MHFPRLYAVLAIVLLSALPAAAPAQSDLDLRNENQRLRTQVGDLTRELAAARARIAELEQQVQDLRDQLARSGAPAPAPGTAPGPPTSPTAPAPSVTLDESKPLASPRALFRALQDSYDQAMKDLEPGDDPSRLRTAYLRAVDSWSRRAQRDLKGPIEWYVRVLPLAEQGQGQPGLRVQAVDPVTGAALGDPFSARVNQTVRRKLAELDRRSGLDVLVLRGVLEPQVQVNPDRLDPGPFDNPKLIGPFAEFGYTVDASSLTPPPQANGDTGGGQP